MTDEFRAAGEFYGHLLAAVPFGDVTMRREGQSFVYQWRSEFDQEHFSAEFEITDVELMQTRFLFPATPTLGDLARTVVAGWRREVKEPRR